MEEAPVRVPARQRALVQRGELLRAETPLREEALLPVREALALARSREMMEERFPILRREPAVMAVRRPARDRRAERVAREVPAVRPRMAALLQMGERLRTVGQLRAEALLQTEAQLPTAGRLQAEERLRDTIMVRPRLGERLLATTEERRLLGAASLITTMVPALAGELRMEMVRVPQRPEIRVEILPAITEAELRRIMEITGTAEMAVTPEIRSPISFTISFTALSPLSTEINQIMGMAMVRMEVREVPRMAVRRPITEEIQAIKAEDLRRAEALRRITGEIQGAAIITETAEIPARAPLIKRR